MAKVSKKRKEAIVRSIERLSERKRRVVLSAMVEAHVGGLAANARGMENLVLRARNTKDGGLGYKIFYGCVMPFVVILGFVIAIPLVLWKATQYCVRAFVALGRIKNRRNKRRVL